MPPRINRRTATRVKSGQVQHKNRHRPTTHEGYVLDRESPGRGFRHVVTKREVQDFIDIIPDWETFSERLERIVLSKHSETADASYEFFHREETGAIYLNAWPENLWTELATSYFAAHRDVFKRLGVSNEPLKDAVVCRFTEAQARAYMLLHVFLHELGHHFDHIHQKHKGSSKGEDYAEQFATSRFEPLYPEYVRVFGDPAIGE